MALQAIQSLGREPVETPRRSSDCRSNVHVVTPASPINSMAESSTWHIRQSLAYARRNHPEQKY